jgi:hypothetical protein
MDSAPYRSVAVHAKNWEQIGASPALINKVKCEVLLPWTGQPRLGVRREYPLTPEDHEFATQKNGSVDHSRLCGTDYRGRGATDGPGGLRLCGSRVKASHWNRLHSPKRAPRDSEILDGYIGRPGHPAVTRRCPAEGRLPRRKLSLEIKTVRPEQVSFRPGGTIIPFSRHQLSLSPAPHLFNKLLSPVIQELRGQGHRFIGYLDDITGAPRASNQDLPATPEGATQAGQEIISLFRYLGIILHPKKSNISGKDFGATGQRRGLPTQIMYPLSPEKLHKLSRAAQFFRRLSIQNKRRCPLRDLQRFCGSENSTNMAVTDALLHLCALFNCAGAAHPSRRVALCHQSLRDLDGGETFRKINMWTAPTGTPPQRKHWLQTRRWKDGAR